MPLILSRRAVIKSVACIALASTGLASFACQEARTEEALLKVQEVAMVLPNMLRVEIWEPAIGHRGVEHTGVNVGNSGDWVKWKDIWALPIDPEGFWVKYEDQRNSVFLNRAIADDFAAYPSIGGNRVAAVYRKSVPRDWGECYGDIGAKTAKTVSMRHFLYLHLEQDLPTGEHLISFPPGMVVKPDGLADLAPHLFTFDERTTRCSAIRHNQVGHAPKDRMKYAYLAEWVPGYGTEGRVPFFNIQNWHIIDSDKSVVWSSNKAPNLLLVADDVEKGSAIDSNDRRLTSTTKPQRKVVGYTIGGPCVVTYDGPDIGEGTIIRFEGIQLKNKKASPLNSGGPIARNFVAASVGMDGPKTFLLMKTDPKTDAPSEPYLAADGEEWQDGGTIFETNPSNNRAGTYLYGLDFSSFVPEKEGKFQVFVPGLGVSHSFTIDTEVWHNVAATMAAGEYHHRHEIALDGRFGYSRPPGFSAKSQKIFRNLTPLYFSNEVGRPPNEISNAGITGKVSSPMHTTAEATFAPGHHDAGDHDSRIGSHAISYYGYMDFFERFPEAAQSTKWNIPKMTELFPEEGMYSGTEALPDCIQQAMFGLHGYIKAMSPEGEVCGGVNWSSFSGLVPSWLVSSGAEAPKGNTVFLYNPDHVCGFILAGLLAKLANCLKVHPRHAVLSDEYKRLALLCWERAELVYDSGSDWNASSKPEVQQARSKMYDSGGTQMPGGYKTAADSLIPGAFEENFTYVQKLIPRQGIRLAASAILLRLTGDEIFADELNSAKFNPGYDFTLNFSIALYEYALNLSGDGRRDKLESLAAALNAWVETNFLKARREGIGFRPLKRWSTNANFGADGTDWSLCVAPLIALYTMKEKLEPGSGAELRDVMEDGWAYALGANLTGKSLVTGLGTDPVTVALHNDSSAMGVPVPKGIMLYGPSRRNFILSLSFAGNSSLNFITMNSSPSFVTDFEHFRRIDPSHFAWPRQEHFFESPGLIEMTEYVFGGSIGPQQWLASVLWATSGRNTAP